MNNLSTVMLPILVVDDEKNYRIILSRILEGAGYRVLTADRAQTAMQLLQEQSVALILSDLRMPEFDGLELCRRVTRDIGSIPFILFSAFISTQYQQELDRTVTNWGHLSKPFDNQAVLSLVKEVLATSDCAPEVAPDLPGEILVREKMTSEKWMSKKLYTYTEEQEKS